MRIPRLCRPSFLHLASQPRRPGCAPDALSASLPLTNIGLYPFACATGLGLVAPMVSHWEIAPRGRRASVHEGDARSQVAAKGCPSISWQLAREKASGHETFRKEGTI